MASRGTPTGEPSPAGTWQSERRAHRRTSGATTVLSLRRASPAPIAGLDSASEDSPAIGSDTADQSDDNCASFVRSRPAFSLVSTALTPVCLTSERSLVRSQSPPQMTSDQQFSTPASLTCRGTPRRRATTTRVLGGDKWPDDGSTRTRSCGPGCDRCAPATSPRPRSRTTRAASTAARPRQGARPRSADPRGHRGVPGHVGP